MTLRAKNQPERAIDQDGPVQIAHDDCPSADTPCFAKQEDYFFITQVMGHLGGDDDVKTLVAKG
jgi:hypothetical protein